LRGPHLTGDARSVDQPMGAGEGEAELPHPEEPEWDAPSDAGQQRVGAARPRIGELIGVGAVEHATCAAGHEHESEHAREEWREETMSHAD
jgi:hypothetical protein